VNNSVDLIGEPIVWSSSYPEIEKYQYKGDYSEFKDFVMVDYMDFTEYYNTYRDLLNDCDLAVVGEFVDDPWQDIDPDDYTEIQPLDFSSYNRFKINSILSAEGPTTTEQGTDIIISQDYAIKGGSIISRSKLTPMLKGDKWVYFLKYSEKDGVYYPLNDYMGRYPDPYFNWVYNRDPDIKDSANRFLPAMTNKYGLTDENDFNENIFRTLADILYHEYMPPVQCLYDSENLEMYNIRWFELAECPGIVFNVRDDSLYIDQPWSSVDPDGISVTGQDVLHKIYTADVTGDGNNDVCIQVRSISSKFGEYILIWDCFDNTVYAVMGQTSKYEYYLGDVDGELIAYMSKLTSDGSKGEAVSHEKLSLNMNDCFTHLNMGGHYERCLHDFEYCARQEGDCPLKSGGHTQYCTINHDYCAQQEGDCPYTGNHHNEVTSSEHHGHSEYCLQNADYCSQQSGECPYTGNHHNEDTSNGHHGHSKYCLQDADYCSQQEGECPYRPADLEDMPTVINGHNEHCLEDADYCAQQEGECPYTGSHHNEETSSGHHGEDHSSEHGGHH
ncbi:MAG: hypothetical protein K2J79_08500, partial [Ruminiclostridium sp.]|nr:hypothetical protein [Ruminiclostridium sp.]